MIVKALHKQLKEKSVKTRQCCFNMLTELVNVLPGALTQHIPVLIPGNDTQPLLPPDKAKNWVLEIVANVLKRKN